MKNRRINDYEFDGEEYYLKPGHIFFSTEPSVVKTILGNCVSVCLWDKVLKYGSVNHFIYPRAFEKEKATPEFGNAATLALIKIMEDASCKREDLMAQIFGGAAPESGKENPLGERNISIARNILLKKNIKIASEDVGGALGRKIIFDTASGHVAVLKVHKLRESDWYLSEI